MEHPHIFVFIGPQGSGKGTQAEIFARKHGFQVFTMGEFLRKESSSGTELGNELKQVMSKGELIPNDLIFALLQEGLGKLPAGAGLIFDGFPRTVEQAQELDKLVDVHKVVHIDLPHAESIRRISGRRVCGAGHNFNIYTLPPKRPNICDFDGTTLTQREDDTEEAIARRLEIYEKVTTKVLGYYQNQGKLITVNGNTSVPEVTAAIEQQVFAHANQETA